MAQRGSVTAIIESVSPDVVINAAAFTNVDSAEQSPELAKAVNATGAGEAAAAAGRRGARFIHVSTDYVFTRNGPHDEAAQACPANVYGSSKREGELAVLAEYPAATIVRASGVFSGSGADFPSAIWSLAYGNREIRVVKDQKVTPVYVNDLAERLLTLALSPDAAGIFHCAGEGATWFDVACETLTALEQSGGPSVRPIPIRSCEFPRLAPRPVDSRLCGSRLVNATGMPDPDWRSGLRLALRTWDATRNGEFDGHETS